MTKEMHPSHIDRMIDRQVALWEVRARVAAEGGEEARARLAHLEQGPWITVSKQLGSGGTDVARRVCDLLGWQIYDREILETISKQTHARERILSGLDQHAVKRFEQFISNLFSPGEVSQPLYLREMMRVICGLARGGNAVIVGRGANWLLEPRYGLRVRFIAPDEIRAARIAESEGVDIDEARARIRRDDADLAAFIRQVYGRNIDDPQGYDLIVNLATLDIETASILIASALESKLRATP